MRRVHLPRELLLVASVAALALGILLGLTALDVARWHGRIADDDVRFRTGGGSGRLWQPAALAPFGAAERALAIRDDLAFRSMLVDLRASKLRDATISDPALALRRTSATERLESIVARDPDPLRRSRASTLLGVLGLVAWNTAPAGANTQDRSELLLSAIASFEEAIDLDPENDDAKYNLQLMLLRGQGLLPTEAAAGKNPLPGGRGSRGAGAGEPGSGY